MNPQDDNAKDQNLVHLQEQFSDGIRDTSLPAAQVLIQQGEARDSNERAPLYVP